MVDYLALAVAYEQHFCKALPNDVIKVNAVTPNWYQKKIRQLQQHTILYHTHQLKDERTIRFVIQNFYHSIPVGS